MNPNMSAYHCQYCMCPKDIWKKALESYNGDECKLYSDFLDIAEALSVKEIIEFIKDHPDMDKPFETMRELIDICMDTGVLYPKEGRRGMKCALQALGKIKTEQEAK